MIAGGRACLPGEVLRPRTRGRPHEHNHAVCAVNSGLPCLLFCVLLSSGPLALAEQPAAPRPAPGHARLGYFVGTWHTEGEFPAGPMGPGGKMTATETCEWFEGRFSIVCHSEGDFPAGPNRSNSGMTMTTVSRGTVQGDTWTYDDESTMGGRLVRTRVTMKELSPTSYTFRMEALGADGTWAPLIESRATKVRPE